MRSLPALLTALACTACGGGSSSPDAGDACAGPAKTPANLVKDPGFECASSTTWGPAYGDYAVVADAHAGSHAGQVTVGSGGLGQFGSADAVFTNAGATQKTLCAVAWMKGSSPNGRLSVMVDTGGGGQEYTFTSPLGASWIRLPLSTNLEVPVPAGGKVYLKFVARDGSAGQTALVDDVDLWESTTAHCSETR